MKMLFGERGKYLGIVCGIALASVLMIQQPEVWVMAPLAQQVDDSKPMLDTQLYRVRGSAGWPGRPEGPHRQHGGASASFYRCVPGTPQEILSQGPA